MSEYEPEIKKKIKAMRQPLKFNILKQFNKARASNLSLPHGDVRTPVYMPVGTKGAMKGFCRLIFMNRGNVQRDGRHAL